MKKDQFLIAILLCINPHFWLIQKDDIWLIIEGEYFNCFSDVTVSHFCFTDRQWIQMINTGMTLTGLNLVGQVEVVGSDA